MPQTSCSLYLGHKSPTGWHDIKIVKFKIVEAKNCSKENLKGGTCKLWHGALPSMPSVTSPSCLFTIRQISPIYHKYTTTGGKGQCTAWKAPTTTSVDHSFQLRVSARRNSCEKAVEVWSISWWSKCAFLPRHRCLRGVVMAPCSFVGDPLSCCDVSRIGHYGWWWQI